MQYRKKERKMQYKGIIDKVYYSGQDWSAIYMGVYGKTKKIEKYIRASGAISNPIEGFEIEVEGDDYLDPKWGIKFNVTKSKIKKSSSEAGVLSFLTSNLIKGIGPAVAKRIYDAFGKNSLKVIEEEPEQLLKIKGIKKKTLDKITKSYQESVGYFKVYEALNGKITPNQARKLMDKYGGDTVKILKKNPYRIIYELDGFGFLKADEIAKASGVPMDSLMRVGAALIYILKTKSESDGHCYIDTGTLQLEGIRLLVPFPLILSNKMTQVKLEKEMELEADNWDTKKLDIISKYSLNKSDIQDIEEWIKVREHYIDVMANALYAEIKAKRIVYEETIDAIYWSSLYKAECSCAENIAFMVTQRPVKEIPRTWADAAIKNIEFETGYELGIEQKEAIYKSLRNRLSIITGGPGRGKTTIIRAIIDAWNDDENVILCAPTGRAAQRMKEATGHEASTLQSLVGMELEDKLVIIDESSMIDILLGQSAFELARDCNLVFVGDVDQLPSIGAGNFFADMIRSGIIPTTVLKTGYRNEGSISVNAERINAGKGLKYMDFDENFEMIETSKEQVVAKILQTYQELLKTYTLKDVCIICPMRKRSQSGTESLNRVIRDAINPFKKNMKVIEKLDFRPGDRVMNTQNNKKKLVYKAGHTEEGVFNGDCGIIKYIDPEENEVEIEFDDGRIGVFDPLEMQTFVLAYAITIHKSQGSEYQALIIVLNKEHYIMLQRNLLYTAVTRGKTQVKIIGEAQAFNWAVNNTDYKLRNSQLRQRIIAQKISRK